MSHRILSPKGVVAALLVVLATAVPAFASGGANPPDGLRFAQSLALSPDGSTLLFGWAGDIWSVAADGGDARRLTVHPAEDTTPVWSPDGSLVAFTTYRHGNGDVYVMRPDGTGPRRLTWLDHGETVGGWFPEGDRLLVLRYEGGAVDRDWAFHVQPVDGSTSRLLTSIRGRGARPSPDGLRIVFERGSSSWDRKGYVGSASRDLHAWTIGSPATQRLTEAPGNDGRAAWAGDQHLFFLSERSGVANVWTMPAEIGERAARQLTFQGTDMVRDFSVSADGRVLVYAAWDTVYRAEAPEYRPVALTIRAPGDRAYLGASSEVRMSGADEVAPSPSGEEMAVVVRGDIFLVPTKENRPTRPVTRSAARDRMVAWAPDGREFYFISDAEDGVEQVYRAVPVFAPKQKEGDAAEDDAEVAERGEASGAGAGEPAPAAAPVDPTPATPEEPGGVADPLAGTPAEEAGGAEGVAHDGTTDGADREAGAPEPAEADATPEPTPPDTVVGLAARIAQVERRLAATGERIAALEVEIAAAAARVDSLDRLGARSEVLRDDEEVRAIRRMIVELHAEAAKESAAGDTRGAPSDAIAHLTRRLDAIAREIAEAERARLETRRAEHATLDASFLALVAERGDLAVRLAALEAAPPATPAPPTPPAASEATKPAVPKEEPIELEDRPLWRAVDFRVERLTHSRVAEFSPTPSPDGTKLAFTRERGSLVILDLESRTELVLFEHWDQPSFAWSPDGRWIAYAIDDHEFNSDVWIAAADGTGTPYNVSRHPDWDGNPSWSSDGKVLAFASRRQGDHGDIYFVYTDRKLEEATTLELEEYYEKAAEGHKARLKTQASKFEERRRERVRAERAAASPADAAEAPGGSGTAAGTASEQAATATDAADAKKKGEKKEKPFRVEIDFDRLPERLHAVTSLPGDQYRYVMAPDGASFLVVRDGSLVTIKWNGRDLKETGVEVGGASLVPSPDGSRVFYLASGGRPASVTLSGGGRESHSMRVRQTIDLDAERAQKFDDAARTLGRVFYHPTMKGLDWGALSARYRDLALATTTRDEFNTVVSYLFGELNASHLGIWGGEPAPPAGSDRTGRLGIDLDPAHDGDGVRVGAVVRDSPADRAASRLAPGDVILEIDGRPLARSDNFHREMADRLDEPVRLTVATAPIDAATADAPTTRTVTIEPISTQRLESLRYEQWVAERRALVEEWSGGRLAYAHVRGMSMPSAEQLERDLYAVAHGKDGLVLDVRFNGGGWTADILLTIMDTRQHAMTLARGASVPGYPQDRRLVYQWSRPAILLCNEKSFSNAEIFSHAWKALGRGLLVGMPTAGGVISTGGTTLIDGTTIRLPFRGWFTLNEGLDMENNGAVPDLLVPHTPDDMLRGEDPQLRRAVDALLEQLAAAPTATFTPIYD